MRVTIFGSGYVGLVTGACLAETGNHVLCVDIDASKVERLKAGEVPIYEPGLDELVARNVKQGRLRFAADVAGAVAGTEIVFIAVDRTEHVVVVRRERVVEIAFDGLQRSSRYDSGLALRFARVKRFRPDKRAAEATSIAEIRAMMR